MQDLDKWESRLATWKETLVRKARELDQRKDSVNQFSQQRESRAADLLRKLTSERNALAVDKDALRKARHAAEGEFQEQTTLLRYRRKELAAIESRCKDQIEECERREAQLVQHELAVKTFSDEVLSQQKELEERAQTVFRLRRANDRSTLSDLCHAAVAAADDDDDAGRRSRGRK